MKAVSMREICMSFPGILANDHVNFEVEKGSIHCLLGENGSGKTTLMNVLFGLYKKDSGEILINGQPVDITGPSDAEALGIGMVHQHFMLIPQLSVLDNIILGNEPGKLTINRKEAKRKVVSLIGKYNFKLDIDKRVADISVGMKQKVEILKLLYRGAEIVIFDEPTAVLTPHEVSELFQIFKALVSQGCTIIFITHKLNEIFAVSDTVTVLRKGKQIGTVPTKDIDETGLSEMMIGRQLNEIKDLEPTVLGDKVLSIENIRLFPTSPPIDIFVRRGEIVGIAGIDGNGQIELEEYVNGVLKPKEGIIRICGKDVSKLGVRARKENGVAYIPSDRVQSGAILQASIKENFLLGYQDSEQFKKGVFVDYKTLCKDSLKLKDEFDVRLVSIEQPFSGLSGGNQQKVVLAREVSKNINFVLAAQPIRGLDISAIEFIHGNLLRLRGEGKGVLLISAELSELLELCDRIIVLFDGRITGSYERAAFNENEIGLAMIGKERYGDGR